MIKKINFRCSLAIVHHPHSMMVTTGFSWFARVVFCDSCIFSKAHFVTKWKAFGADKAKVLYNPAYQGCFSGRGTFLYDCTGATEVILRYESINDYFYCNEI